MCLASEFSDTSEIYGISFKDIYLHIQEEPHTSEKSLTHPRRASHIRVEPHTSEKSLTHPRRASHIREEPHTSEKSLTHPKRASHIRKEPHTSEKSLMIYRHTKRDRKGQTKTYFHISENPPYIQRMIQRARQRDINSHIRGVLRVHRDGRLSRPVAGHCVSCLA